jgi:DNA-binding transcriptional ArsR family regulator
MRMSEDAKTGTLAPDGHCVELAAEVFSLLSDVTRIKIILALGEGEGELAVGELAERVGKRPTTVSQHLAKLRWAKVVAARQDGARVYYSLIGEHALQLVTHAVFQAEHVLDGALARHHLAPTVLAAGVVADRADRATA